MRPGRSFCVSGLIHVILMIQYEKKGAVVMTQTLAYTVIHTPEADRLYLFGEMYGCPGCESFAPGQNHSDQ